MKIINKEDGFMGDMLKKERKKYLVIDPKIGDIGDIFSEIICPEKAYDLSALQNKYPSKKIKNIQKPIGMYSSSWNEYNEKIKYLTDLRRRIVENLTRELNKLHGIDFSFEFWNLILDYWIDVFLPNIYDKYLKLKSLEDVESLYTISKFYTDNRAWREVDEVYGFAGYGKNLNLLLYARVCEFFNIEVKYITNSLFEEKLPRLYALSWHAYILLRNIRKVVTDKNRIDYFRLPKIGSNAKCLLFESNLNKDIETEIVNDSQGLIQAMDVAAINRFYDFRNASRRSQKAMRKKLHLDFYEQANEFEMLCAAVLPEFIPVDCLEGFKSIYNKVNKTIAESSPYKAYQTGVSDCIGIIMYEAVLKEKKGTKLIGVQSTAFYGVSNLSERGRAATNDEFLTWGWQSEDEAYALKTRPCAIIRCPEANIYRFHNQKKILYISNWLDYYEVGYGWDGYEYVSRHFRFIDCLGVEEKNNLVTRLRDRHGKFTEKYASQYKDIRTEDISDCDLKTSVLDSALVVCDSYGSSHIEAMLMGIPTIFFMGVDFNVRPCCRKWLDRLEEVGIFANTPEEAVARVEKVYGNIREWWDSEPIQEAVKGYLNEFASNYDQVKECWQEEFMDGLMLDC